MHLESRNDGLNESQSAQTNFGNIMNDINTTVAIVNQAEVMNHTATSIISTKKELMDKIDFVSKTESK